MIGSAKLDIDQKGGDSLMGRYLLYRIHPLTIGELCQKQLSEEMISAPRTLESTDYENLLNLGGFPDPLLKESTQFARQWRQLRRQQLFREDIRDLKQIQDIAHIEMLATLLRNQSSAQLNYSKLAKLIKVSVDTVTRWINILEEFFYCFKLQPWHRNVKRSLIKEPKIYLWDWADFKDHGARVETLLLVTYIKPFIFGMITGMVNLVCIIFATKKNVK